ncbi:MAG: glycosyltransferase involved in cell wall biosynthesis [Saprospiraceae bacterium]
MTLYQQIKNEGLSIIIPSYNNEAYIGQCISSVLAHDLVSQVLVVDDGSSDDSLKIMHSFNDTRLQTLTHFNNVNRGRSATRNLGIINAKGLWIGFCDSDDYWLPNRFAAFHNEYPADLDGIYGHVQNVFFNTESRILYNKDVVGLDEDVDPSDLLDYMLQTQRYFSIIALIFKRAKIDDVGAFDIRLALAEDTDLIWRLAANCFLYPEKNKELVCMRRIHEGSSRLRVDMINLYQKKLYEMWSTGERAKLLSVKSRTLMRAKISQVLRNSS